MWIGELIGHLNCDVPIRIRLIDYRVVLNERCLNIYERTISVLKYSFRKQEILCCCLLGERYAGAHY